MGSLEFLTGKSERCEILIQWIQRLITDSIKSGVLSAPPPLVTRTFQDLSSGLVSFNNARKLNEIPFPFPFAQALAFMMLMLNLVYPLWCAAYAASPIGAFQFSTPFLLFSNCVNYIAAEIEMPFGDDPNDLPMNDM